MRLIYSVFEVYGGVLFVVGRTPVLVLVLDAVRPQRRREGAWAAPIGRHAQPVAATPDVTALHELHKCSVITRWGVAV